MFVQDLTTITNEIKRMDVQGTSIVPPSSSWFQWCSFECTYLFNDGDWRSKNMYMQAKHLHMIYIKLAACSFCSRFKHHLLCDLSFVWSDNFIWFRSMHFKRNLMFKKLLFKECSYLSPACDILFVLLEWEKWMNEECMLSLLGFVTENIFYVFNQENTCKHFVHFVIQ